MAALMSAPFPNDYRCRQVAESDSRPCNICFKPTSTVLLASNKADHFYVCPLHLKDKSFASAVLPEAYTQLLKDRVSLEEKIRQANSLAEANKPYSWNKLMNNIGWSDTQPEPKDEDNSKEDEEEKKKKNETYQDYVSRANDLKKKLADVNSSVAAFQFKQYTLVKDVYRMRVNNALQAKNRVPRPKSAQDSIDVSFPSVPKSDIN